MIIIIYIFKFIKFYRYPPFYSDTREGIFKSIEEGKFDMTGREWKHISNDAKDLITQLLDTSERKRLKAAEALNHPFFSILEKKPEANSKQQD